MNEESVCSRSHSKFIGQGEGIQELYFLSQGWILQRETRGIGEKKTGDGGEESRKNK
jgi:hypothetical protein